MRVHTAVVLGGTGLIGSHLIEFLLTDPRFSRVVLLTRRPLDRLPEKVEVLLTDFSKTQALPAMDLSNSCLFCALGTTMKKVQEDKQRYRQIDLDIPLRVAEWALQQGCQKMALVSSLGARAGASNFYLRLKGELEERLAALPLEALHIMQPSLLMGHRQEHRAGEKFFQNLFGIINGVLKGPLAAYHGIEGRRVAQAMIEASQSTDSGLHRYRYLDMVRLTPHPHPQSS